MAVGTLPHALRVPGALWRRARCQHRAASSAERCPVCRVLWPVWWHTRLARLRQVKRSRLATIVEDL